MSGYKAECRKFQANIFNKSKCTNCFKQREEHSTDALDSNRASRKVSKCGYLFVAPDWDFTIPLYRTKRWQRRWFVLYDDGELTYSVDDLPATIPQGVVDMNRVLEVSNAEDITGNKYSLALTAPDRVTFVKGTSPEESRWWQDVLSIFPRMHKHGRHKRNATFPGIKGSSGGVSSTSAGHQHVRVGTNPRGPSTLESPVNQRVRFNSISSDLRGARRPSSAPSLDSTERHLFSSGRFGSPAVTASSGRGGSSSSSSRHYDSVNESSNGSDVSNEEEDEDQRRADSIATSAEVDNGPISQDVGDVVVVDNSTRNNNDKNSFYNNNNSGNSNRNTGSFTEPYSSSYGGAYYSGSNNNLSSTSGVTPNNSLHYSRSVAIPTPTTPSATPASLSTPLPSNPSRMMRDEHKENTPPYMPEYHDNPPTSESPPTQDKHTHRLRTRRALNREARALSQPRNDFGSSYQDGSSRILDHQSSRDAIGSQAEGCIPLTSTTDRCSLSGLSNTPLSSSSSLDARRRSLFVSRRNTIPDNWKVDLLLSAPACTSSRMARTEAMIVPVEGSTEIGANIPTDFQTTPAVSSIPESSSNKEQTSPVPLKSILKKTSSQRSNCFKSGHSLSSSPETSPDTDTSVPPALAPLMADSLRDSIRRVQVTSPPRLVRQDAFHHSGTSRNSGSSRHYVRFRKFQRRNTSPELSTLDGRSSSCTNLYQTPDFDTDNKVTSSNRKSFPVTLTNKSEVTTLAHNTHASGDSTLACNTGEQLQPCSVLADLEASKREEKLKDIAASITTTSSRRRHHQLHHHANSQGSAVDKPTRDRDPENAADDNAPTDTPPPAQLRGTPDGCGGVDDSSSGNLQRVDLPAEDLLYIKKGWLLKAGDKQEWNKYWFVLHGGGLRFYRNSGAEDTGIMDGIIDLGTAKDIHNKDVTRNYGFVIKTWSGQQYVFSAVTAGIRNNWVQALRNAANLKTAPALTTPADPDKEALNKSAIIESLAAEKDPTSINKSLQAYNNKNNSLSNSMNNIINNKSYTVDGTDKSTSFTNSVGVSKSNSSLNAIEDGNGRSHINGLSGDNSQLQGTSSPLVSRIPHHQSGSRVAALSSDEEYKTASETSANSNLSNDNADFFDWEGSRSRTSSGRNKCNERRSQSSPPNSRRGTLDSFPNMEASYGLNSSILDRYKNMQNHTRSQVTQSPASRTSTTTTSAAPDEVDHPRGGSRVSQHQHCDALSTCARLSNLDRDDTGFRLSDSMRSLDLDASLQHDKCGGTTSSQETLSNPNELEETKLSLTDSGGYLADTRARLADTRDRLAETRDQLEIVQKQNLQYQTELKDSKNELLRCQMELEESKVEASRYLGQLEQSQSEVLQYKTQLEESRNVVLKFQAQLEGSTEEVCQYQNQLEESQNLVHQLQQQLEESQDFVHLLQQQLEQTRNELEKTQHHLQEACENHVAFKAEMEEQNSLRQRLQSQNTVAEAVEESREELLKDLPEGGTSCPERQSSRHTMEHLNQMNELVSSLRDEVDRLTDQLSLKERQLVEENSALQALRLKHDREKSAWRGRAESNEQQLQQLADSRQDTILQLRSSLEASEHRVAVLAAQLEGRNSRTAKEGHAATNNTLDALQRENTALARQLSENQAEAAQLKDNLKCEKSEVYKWKDLVKELRSLLDGRNVDMDRKREEIRVTRESLRSQQQEHAVTRDRLQRGIEENEALSTRIRELQRQLHSQEKRASSTPSVYSSREKFSSRRQLPRLDSLSDLSNVDFSIDPELLDKEALTDEYCDVRARLERAINEIRALRRELRESQDAHDSLQLAHLQQGQDLTRQKQNAVGQLQLMTDRVQDLTNKLSNSEKQVRLLKTKVTRAAAESRDRRRTHSLKGKDAFGLGKDVDQKLSQLEAKIAQLMPTIDTGLVDSGCHEDNSKTPSDELRASATSTPTSCGSRPHLKHTKRSKSFDDPSKATRLRRKSLESPNGGDGGVKAALRINNLEAKVAALTPARSRSPSRTGSPAESPLRSPSMTRRTKSRSSLAERGSRARRTDSDLRSSLTDLPATDTLGLVCSQLCECVEWLDTYRCSCGNADLSSLQQRLTTTHQLAAEGAQLGAATTSPVAERVQPVAQQMVLLLQQKIAALAERRDTLKATSSWTKEAQMKNFAERIAFETVLLSQVAQALRLTNQSNCNLESIKLQDLMESHRKMAFLEKKLTNPEFDLDTMAPLEFYTSMLAEKLVVTGEVLSSVNNSNDRKHDSTLDATCRDLQGRLLERERQLARLVMSYKEEKLHEVAVVMAQEFSSAAPLDETVLMEEVRIREAWTTAHQLLVQEIVNHQTSQSLLRLTHLLNPPNDSKPVASLSLTLCSSEAVDRLQTAAEESLRQEMEESVMTLSQKYEEVLAQYRAGDTSLVNSVSASMDEVLTEFAVVMAQKALIDGHLALLQDEFDKGSLQTTQDSLNISEDNKDPMESAGDVLDSEAHLLMFLGGRDSSVESLVKPALSHSEFTFVFNKASNQCSTESTNLLMQLLSQKAEASELAPLGSSSSYRSSTRSLQHASPAASDRDQDSLEQPQLRSATSLSKILPSPKARRKSETRKSRRSSDVTGMTSLGCRQCEELRHELNKLKKKLQFQNTVDESKECDTCPKLLDTIERLEMAQRANASRVGSSEGDSDDELSRMKERIMVVEASYEAQIAVLQQKYEEALAANPDSCDETAREKYQKEIEQLRGLCEMGLGTMESSQQRIVAEIKEKHRRELTLLQAEKEQALAEETQATLAALDAMRKAHEAEVQREVAKIKEEFIRKMQAGEDIGEITQQHEAEMRDIRREILSLSEKYSVKCLEAADQETRIENLNKQLVDASKTVAELEARNTKLKAQLTEKIEAIKSGASAGDTESELRVRVAEAVVKEDRLAKMNTQLQKAQAMARKEPSSSSRADRRGRTSADLKSSPAKN